MRARDDSSHDDGLDVPAGADARVDPVDAELEEIVGQGDVEPPREVPARISRQPRLGRFLGLGAAIGLLLAAVLTLFWPDDPTFVPDNPNLSFSQLQVFGFLAVYLVPIGLGICGLVGYLLGRAADKRTAVDVTLARGGGVVDDRRAGAATSDDATVDSDDDPTRT